MLNVSPYTYFSVSLIQQMKCFNLYERFWRKSVLFKGAKAHYMKHSEHMCGFQCFVLHIMRNELERWHNQPDDWQYQTILQWVALLVWKLVSLFSCLESWKSSFVQYCIWNILLIALVLNQSCDTKFLNSQ